MFEMLDGYEPKTNKKGTEYVENKAGEIVAKRCGNCKEIKSIGAYGNNKGGLGGKHSVCAACQRVGTNERYYYASLEERSKKASEKYERNKEKRLDYSRNYYQENKEKINIQHKEHYQNNKDHARMMHKKWQEANKERFKQYLKQYNRNNSKRLSELNKRHYILNKERRLETNRMWIKANPERVAVQRQKRRTLLASLPNILTVEQLKEIIQIQKGKCFLSGASENLDLEHFIPISWGVGGTTYENCYMLEKSLNRSMLNKNPFDWINEQPENYQERFNNILVPELARRNGVTVEEFTAYVFKAYENYINRSEDSGD
jgi:hypothetical protein